LNAVLTIAQTTFREALRRRVLNIILVFAVVSMCANSIRFFSMLIAVLLGASMIPNEIERRTIFSILSKPVGRTQFMLGKYLGALLTLIVNVAIMGAIFLLVLFFKDKDRGYLLNPTLWKGIALVVVEVAVLLAIAVAVSTVASTAFNVVFSFFVYFTGQMGGVFKELSAPAGHVTSGVVRALMGLIYNVLPHFENFDLRQPLLLGDPVPTIYVLKVVGAALVYIAVVLAIGHLLFTQREF